ncbi:MAG: hypothetical protein SPD11_01105 [Sphaerochaetaceae bacterium]|nr:hypothetical protein [Sphaerochaetaceae bacterium]
MKRFSARISLFAIIAITILCLVGCASTAPRQQTATAESYDLPYESMYEHVGYKFVYKINDGQLTFNYIDILSDAEIQKTADTIMGFLPEAASFEVSAPGQITFKLASVPSKAQFDAFVEKMNSYIHDTMF